MAVKQADPERFPVDDTDLGEGAGEVVQHREPVLGAGLPECANGWKAVDVYSLPDGLACCSL